MSKKDEQLHGIALKTIVFSFTSVLKNTETRDALMKYLKTEHNTEPLEFLNEYEKFQKIVNDDLQASIAQMMHIVNTFIGIQGKDAPKLLNIAAATCSTIRNEIVSSSQHTSPTTWMITKFKSPQHFLAALHDAITFEMRHDSFPRFVRSKIFKEFLAKKDANFIRAISTPQATIEFHYKDSDFEKHIVNDRDFRFFEKLAVDSYDWDLQGFQRLQKESSAISGFYSNRNYLSGVSWAKQGSVAKFCGVLPYNFDFVAETILPGCNIIKLDANARKFHEYLAVDNASMQQSAPEQVKTAYRSTGVISFEVFLPFPMKQTRRYLSATSVEYLPEKEQIMLIHKPCTLSDDKWKLPKGFLEMKSFCCKILRKIDDDTTYFCEVHLFNLAGWAANQSLQRLVIFDRAKELQKCMLRVLKQAKSGTFKTANDKDFILQTLRDCQVAKRRADYLQTLAEKGDEGMQRRKSSAEIEVA